VDKHNKIEINEVPDDDDRRTAYRRAQTQAHRLSISMRAANGAEIPGLLQDLSISGASAKFAINDKVVSRGQIVVVTIGSLTRATSVVAKARVMFSMDSPGGRLCGFHFTEPKALIPQIDSFYGRFFNRRRSKRVGMPLDKKIFAQLFLTGTEVKAEVLDLSIDGMQVRAKRAEAKEFDGSNHVMFRFKLPKRDEELQGRAAILRRSQARDVVTLGLAFDLLDEQGITQHLPALHSWIVHRSNEISKWDNVLTKPEGPKPATPAKAVEPVDHWSNDGLSPRKLA